MNMVFSQTLAHLRREKGISQRQAAQELGVSQALLSHYENGIREPGLAFVVKACDYYQTSADYLLGRTHNRSLAVESAQTDPTILIRMADTLSQVCADLCREEPELNLLFRRLGTQLTKNLDKVTNRSFAKEE